jgi:hypothetical protein
LRERIHANGGAENEKRSVFQQLRVILREIGWKVDDSKFMQLIRRDLSAEGVFILPTTDLSESCKQLVRGVHYFTCEVDVCNYLKRTLTLERTPAQRDEGVDEAQAKRKRRSHGYQKANSERKRRRKCTTSSCTEVTTSVEPIKPVESDILLPLTERYNRALVRVCVRECELLIPRTQAMLLPREASIPVGREAELERVLSFLRACVYEGRGGALYLCGKPGTYTERG